MPRPQKSTPQEIAREILAQIPRSAVIERIRKGGTSYHMDTRELSQHIAQRMGDCGSFPRGRVTLKWQDGSTQDLGAHQCNQRLCPRCGRRRGIRLASDMAGALNLIESWKWTADRTRFVTLTIENTESADAGINRVMEAWHRTLATKTWGRMIAGGFRAVEVKPGKDGRWNVHLHAILYLWTPAVPYQLLREAWDKAARGRYNQRFDTLKNKAKAHPGESKAAAAARYLVKYLVKHEELRGTRRMPGGLPHMLGALEGRRLFGAWGLGAAALRIERHERPRWTATVDRHLAGYRNATGLFPEAAELVTPWETYTVEIPAPPLPQAFRQEDMPDQAEPKAGRWTVRRIHARSPLDTHPWQKLPQAHSRTAAGMKSALEAWLENPRSRGPQPFRWRTWHAGAPKEWTGEAQTLMGERKQTRHLGAMLWDRVQAPPERFPQPDHPEHITHQLNQAHRSACYEARTGLSHACTPAQRVAYLQRLPERIRLTLEEPYATQTPPEWGY